MLGPRNRTLLVRCLKDVGRDDLAALLTPPEDLESTVTSHSSALVLAPSFDREDCPLVWPLSSFRKMTLAICRELEQEEVEKIYWLSKDFLENRTESSSDEMNASELFHTLEENKPIGPGNYSFLVECLDEIGLLDLVSLIQPTRNLPYFPQSLSILAQMQRRQMEVLNMKRTQYTFGMRNLVLVRQMAAQVTAPNAVGWFQRICSSLRPTSIEAYSSFIIEHLPATLINMSLYINAYLDSFQEYESNGDTPKFAEYISESERRLDMLQCLMESVGWDALPRKREIWPPSRQYHPIRQASYGAFSGLAELVLELSSNKEKTQESTRQLSCVLTRLETLIFTIPTTAQNAIGHQCKI